MQVLKDGYVTSVIQKSDCSIMVYLFDVPDKLVKKLSGKGKKATVNFQN